VKIAWFTPFSTKSAIGEYSRRASLGLAKSCDVDLWTADETDLRTTPLTMINFRKDASVLGKLQRYDFVVYNMGDHLSYHRAIYDVSKRTRGIVILHDIVLHHLFAAYYLEHLRQPMVYVDRMRQLYGEAGERVAKESIPSTGAKVWERDDEVLRYPLWDEAVANALGVIVHSNRHANLVRETWYGPVATIFHPCFDEDEPRGSHYQDRKANPDVITMVTTGHVNRNKKIDLIIELMGRNTELARRVRYVVVGSYDPDSEYYQSLSRRIQQYGLQGKIQLLGYQDREVLDEFLASTDIFVNLRSPAMEGASWSLMEQLLAGKPVIVFDEGFFGELPNECVAKVSSNNLRILEDTLVALVQNKGLRSSIGSRGQAFARQFTIKKYADSFLDFLDIVRCWRPAVSICDKVSEELAAMGVDSRSATVGTIAKELNNLVPPSIMPANARIR